MTQIVNNLSHLSGAHALRGGIDVLYHDDRIVFARSLRGSYTFASVAAFAAGVYNNAGFTRTFGETELGLSNPNVGMYVQDEWKVSSPASAGLFVLPIGSSSKRLSKRST